MTDYDLIIRNGRLVTEEAEITGDLAVKDGKIAAIGAVSGTAAREVDAGGRLVFPGGIDTHAHIEQPMAGIMENADSFATGTASALAGGTTSVICFAAQQPGQSLTEAVDAYKAAAAKSRIDYGFHLSINNPTPEVLETEIPALVAEGHRSIKVFMTYQGQRLNDTQVIEVLATARRNGAMVCVHAEHHELIEYFTRELLKAGLSTPKYHPWAKPMVVEREATHRILALAEALDVPVQVFHVSGAESALEVARAKERGLKVWAETCPQYLYFTAEDLDQPGLEAAKIMFSPAPRARADQEALWERLRDGTIEVVSSDHSPTCFDSVKGKKNAGEDAPFNRIPNGVPGLAARLPLLFSAGVATGRIDSVTFAKLTSTNAAKIFGLYPQKGTLSVGSDADFVIWDDQVTRCLTNEMMHHGADYTPYEGMEITGAPLSTWLRGELAFDGSEILAAEGNGAMLCRGPYEQIRPRGIFTTPFNPVDGVLV